MFVIDTLLGNWDRHNGNWGFLYNQVTDDASLAPIYDCGSCLFPQVDDEMIKNILSDKNEFNSRIYNFPTSSIKLNNKRINYYSFIKSHEHKECDIAIDKLKQIIDFNLINKLIDSIEITSDIHKTFLKLIIKERFNVLFNC